MLRERRIRTRVLALELTDGPIPLVAVPGIRDAINIITFDYTEGRKTRGERGRGTAGGEGGEGWRLSILVFQATASAHTRLRSRTRGVCARTSVHTFEYLFYLRFIDFDLLTTLPRQQE